MKYVTITKLAELIGYSKDAIRARIKKSVWRFNEHWIKARDGRIHLTVEAIELWMQDDPGRDPQSHRGRLDNPGGRTIK